MSTSTSRSSRTGGTKKSGTSSRSTRAATVGREGTSSRSTGGTTGSPTPAAAGPAPEKSSRSRKEQPKPLRREIGALVCLLLAIFAAFGYFKIDAVFITFFCNLLWGPVRLRLLVCAPMLLVSSGIQMFHRGQTGAASADQCPAGALPVWWAHPGWPRGGLWPGRQADSAALKSGLS